MASADISLFRVALRVAQGGHDVPEKDVRRRYQRSISNMLSLYLPLADYAEIWHNTQDEGYQKIVTKAGGDVKIHQEDMWKSVTAKI